MIVAGQVTLPPLIPNVCDCNVSLVYPLAPILFVYHDLLPRLPSPLNVFLCTPRLFPPSYLFPVF